MSGERVAQLVAEGFELIETFRVGLPHFVWRVDIDIEFDRELRLVEETVLKLVAADLGDPARIAALMGLDDGRIVPTTVVDLLRKGAVSHRDGRFGLTPMGSNILERAATRETARLDAVELRHDPYRNELRWSFDETDAAPAQVVGRLP
ncbi:hypothetical protein HY251_06645 [bacterium]|nr:hypothetical protein [bacterium]